MTIHLIDGTYELFRHFYAVPKARDKHGVEVAAVRGVIGSLLETAAIAQVIFETRGARLPKPVDITVDYLRSGRAVDSYARARIARQGKRVVNVHAEMWQEDEAKPVANLRGHFLIS